MNETAIDKVKIHFLRHKRFYYGAAVGAVVAVLVDRKLDNRVVLPATLVNNVAAGRTAKLTFGDNVLKLTNWE